jgi:hypothetical protein
VSVERLPGDPGPGGDVHVSVHVAGHGFEGRNRSVWLDRRTVRAFHAALTELEARRTGGVLLEAISPDAFQLSLDIVDAAGHAAVAVRLTRHIFVLGRPQALRADLGFEIDPSDLAGLVRSASELLA